MKLWKCIVTIFIMLEDSARTTLKHVEWWVQSMQVTVTFSHLITDTKDPSRTWAWLYSCWESKFIFWNLQSMKLKTEQLLQLLSRNILLLQLLRRNMIIVLQWVMLILRNCFTCIFNAVHDLLGTSQCIYCLCSPKNFLVILATSWYLDLDCGGLPQEQVCSTSFSSRCQSCVVPTYIEMKC